MVPMGLFGVVLTVLRARKPRVAAAAGRAPSIDYLGAALLIALTVMLTLLLDRRSVEAVGAEQAPAIIFLFSAPLGRVLAYEPRADLPVEFHTPFKILPLALCVFSVLF